MATLSKDQVIVCTIGFNHNGNRAQCVIPFVCESPLVWSQTKDDFEYWLENILFPLWQATLGVSSEIVGFGLDPGAPGFILPFRKNYVVGTYPGTVTGESYPATTSMVIFGRSLEQAGSGSRLRVSLTYIGPPAESKCNGMRLLAAFFNTEVDALKAGLLTGFLGIATGLQYRRALERVRPGVGTVYVIDVQDKNINVSVQRRRGVPIL